MSQNKLALYIHWPFCKSKCPYCDFNSHVATGYDYSEWLKAYLTEIDDFSHYLKDKVITSIFFGGGTPSLMSPEIPEKIIEHLSENYNLHENAEITLETNPTSYETEKFKGFMQAGINRVSIGVQSFINQDLKFLGREHNSDEALQTIYSAKEIFPRVSFDLIYARPEQALDEWEKELEFALSLDTTHMSVYTLTIEKGTRFYSDYMNKKFTMPDADLQDEFYNLTQQMLNDKGLYKYEVSNHAAKGFESLHNLQYWRYDDYLGIGPGAHSRITMNGSIYAIMMLHNPQNWLNQVSKNSNGIQTNNKLADNEIMSEMLMMNLRIFDKIKYSKLASKVPNYKDYINFTAIETLHKQGLIVADSEGFKVTEEGIRVANSIANYIL